MYQALYRKYRPKIFDDVVGQQVIIKTLSNGILNNKISHAYLFTGPRGTGKTSIAKILAKMVNCENLENGRPCNKCLSCTQFNQSQNIDVIEIDAASNNGVDEIRELRNKVNLVPSFGKYKVYIIDEVHMLTTAAFNALLKTLEEPPQHIIFILATTEPHKIPETILSRCQRFDFKKIGTSDIKQRLIFVCNQEKIKIEDSSIELIAKLSDGGMRDSLSLLDQLTSYTLDKITDEDVHNVYGTITNDQIFEFLDKLFKKKLPEVLDLIDKFDNSGKNLIKIIELIVEYLKNLLIFNNYSEYFDNPTKQMYGKICEEVNENDLYKSINIFLNSITDSKNTRNIKLFFEIAVIKIIHSETAYKNISQKKDIEIIDTKKEIPHKEVFITKKITFEEKNEISKIKKIRINNTLAKFNKKELLQFKNNLDRLSEMLMDPDYSSLASLILDGDLKAKGDNYLIFVYKTSKLEEYFNSSLSEIEKVLNLCFDLKLHPISVCADEWEIIKKEFNKNLKEKNNIYKYIEEQEFLEKEIEKSNKNKIEEMFENIIEYN